MLNFIKSILRTIRTVIISLILICIVIFMVNNRDTIQVHFYPLPFDLETKTFLVIILFFILGMFFGILACTQNIISRRIKSFKDHHKINQLEKQIQKK